MKRYFSLSTFSLLFGSLIVSQPAFALTQPTEAQIQDAYTQLQLEAQPYTNALTQGLSIYNSIAGLGNLFSGPPNSNSVYRDSSSLITSFRALAEAQRKAASKSIIPNLNGVTGLQIGQLDSPTSLLGSSQRLFNAQNVAENLRNPGAFNVAQGMLLADGVNGQIENDKSANVAANQAFNKIIAGQTSYSAGSSAEALSYIVDQNKSLQATTSHTLFMSQQLANALYSSSEVAAMELRWKSVQAYKDAGISKRARDQVDFLNGDDPVNGVDPIKNGGGGVLAKEGSTPPLAAAQANILGGQQ